MAHAWLMVALCGGCEPAAIDAAPPEHLPVNAVVNIQIAQSGPVNALAPVLRPEYAPHRWATGGTAVFDANALYAEPFGSSDGTACTPTCAVGLPTCPVQPNVPPERQDISEGHPGLPMRLMLRIVGPDCQPLVGATARVWHPSPEGTYGGPTAYPHMCTGGQRQAETSLAFRGQQRADGRGIVTFDSCFPGRMRGRTVLINVTVSKEGMPVLTTQLVFDDALVADIEASQPLYRHRGVGFTTHAEDPYLPDFSHPDMMLSVAQMPDGAMLAYKTLVVRQQVTEPVCHLLAEALRTPLAQNGNGPAH